MDLLILIVVVLLVLGWGGGLAVGYLAGGALHLLLVLAISIVLVRLVRGQS